MVGNVIQLNQLSFWATCIAGVTLTALLGGTTMRKWCLAALNLAFIASLLGGEALGVVAAVLVTQLLLYLCDRGRSPVLITSLLGLTALALFLLHKLPDTTSRLGMTEVGRVLALIGYSYVALRVVEVFRAVFERRHRAPDLASTINYLLPFHMLAAGPIQAYDDYARQSAVTCSPTTADVLVGLERIANGLFKKFVLAYLLQKLFLTDFQSQGGYLILEIQLFFVWLYLDFSAYSDIAVGVGTLIGVVTPENFNRPIGARNVIDFWERWHISLSLFIRRNLFNPLQLVLMRRTGGGRPLLCVALALTVSFVLCGLWHGLTIGFLLWGAAQALGLVTVRVYGQFLQKRLGKQGVKRYMASPWIRATASALTFEFQAVTLLTLFMGR
jgi:D-alanyl-lipoteichoic acid acyltransferase DltB (MBOAT superfamily)